MSKLDQGLRHYLRGLGFDMSTNPYALVEADSPETDNLAIAEWHLDPTTYPQPAHADLPALVTEALSHLSAEEHAAETGTTLGDLEQLPFISNTSRARSNAYCHNITRQSHNGKGKGLRVFQTSVISALCLHWDGSHPTATGSVQILHRPDGRSYSDSADTLDIIDFEDAHFFRHSLNITVPAGLIYILWGRLKSGDRISYAQGSVSLYPILEAP